MNPSQIPDESKIAPAASANQGRPYARILLGGPALLVGVFLIMVSRQPTVSLLGLSMAALSLALFATRRGSTLAVLLGLVLAALVVVLLGVLLSHAYVVR